MSIYTLLTNTKSAKSVSNCCRGFQSRVTLKTNGRSSCTISLAIPRLPFLCHESLRNINSLELLLVLSSTDFTVTWYPPYVQGNHLIHIIKQKVIKENPDRIRQNQFNILQLLEIQYVLFKQNHIYCILTIPNNLYSAQKGQMYGNCKKSGYS